MYTLIAEQEMASPKSTERTPLMNSTYHYHVCGIHSKYALFLGVSLILLITALWTIAMCLMKSTDNKSIFNPLNPLPIDFTNDSDKLTLLKSPSSPGTVPLKTLSPTLQPLLKKKWPLEGKPPLPWFKPSPPSKTEITAAVRQGKLSLKSLTKLEFSRQPLTPGVPAVRAQRASATSADVKPLADFGYAVETATRVLAEGFNVSLRVGGVGQGPPLNGSFPEPPYCLSSPPCLPSRYRSYDGTCNNLANPVTWGVSKTPFRRVLPANYGDGISSPRLSSDGTPLPNARDVSLTIHRPIYGQDSIFTVMLAVYGQFLDHDITATAISKGQNGSSLMCCDPTQVPHPACFPVDLDLEDPSYHACNITCMEFVRSASAPTCHFGPREQLNQATAYIDASSVYGFSTSRINSLRTGTGGLLKMLSIGTRDLLPVSTDPTDGCNTVEMNAKGQYCFASGDDRSNENLHLTTMHLIWARQHNRIASILKAYNPLWDDESLFQETRKILGAQMQHITYTEFLPNILGEDMMHALNLTVQDSGYSDTYDPTVDPSIANHFSAAAFRFAHTLLPGLIRNTDTNTGSVQYIHLHRMLFNPYSLYTEAGPKSAMLSAMNTAVHTVDPHVTAELTNHLFESPLAVNTSDAPGSCGLDLVSLNIQRGRDHGLPPYPAWREHCGFTRPETMEDLQEIFDNSSLSRIQTIFKSVDDIDLYTGALAEDSQGRLLGLTISCLVADQFLRLKIGDRFWYETPDNSIGFTLAQLTEIRKTTLAGVICANEPTLDQAQPRVMEVISPTNPLMDCKEIPQSNFQPWIMNPFINVDFDGNS